MPFRSAIFLAIKPVFIKIIYNGYIIAFYGMTKFDSVTEIWTTQTSGLRYFCKAPINKQTLFLFPADLDNKDALTTSDDMIPLSKRPGYTGNHHLPKQKNMSVTHCQQVPWIKANGLQKHSKKKIQILCFHSLLLKLFVPNL